MRVGLAGRDGYQDVLCSSWALPVFLETGSLERIRGRGIRKSGFASFRFLEEGEVFQMCSLEGTLSEHPTSFH